MVIYVSISVVAIGLMLLLTGNLKAALIASVVFIVGGFGYRLYSGEEVRAVVADVLFVVALLPIGWWAAKQCLGIADSSQTNSNN